jgi:hypothetical protein
MKWHQDKTIHGMGEILSMVIIIRMKALKAFNKVKIIIISIRATRFKYAIKTLIHHQR